MKTYRLSWSGYQTTTSLQKERSIIKDLGLAYERAEQPGKLPDNPAQYDIYITNSGLNLEKDVIERLQYPELILTTTNGYDHIDLAACREASIDVARTPRARARPVANYAITCLKGLLRQIPASNAAIRDGQWHRESVLPQTYDLSSLSVGIIGYGMIGNIVVKKLRALEKSPYEILISDPNIETEHGLPVDVELTKTDQLLRQSNVVSLHANLNETSREIITNDTINTMPEPSFVINTARGSMVDTGGIVGGLESGDLTGAALDVYAEEPFVIEDQTVPDNLILTPHTAGFSGSMLANLRNEIGETLKAFKDDRALPSPVITPEP